MRPLKDLAAMLYQSERYDEAVQFLGRARALAPKDARTWYALGLAQEARQDPGAAIAAYRESIRAIPGLPIPKRHWPISATLGEHEQAILVLDDLLRLERTNEQAAANRDAWRERSTRCWRDGFWGRRRTVKTSTLVQQGGLLRLSEISDGAGQTMIRYGTGIAELWAFLATNGELSADAGARRSRAGAKKRDTMFRVTVVGASGRREPANYATAITLTFLREALGVPLTQASDLYARLLGGAPHLSWNGARLCFTTVRDPERDQMVHGLAVEIVQPERGAREGPLDLGGCCAGLRASAGLFSLMSVMLLGAASLGCRSSRAPAPAKSESSRAPSQGITFIEDDYEGAKKRALAEHLPLFVDAWAPWCHTCLSMKEYVWGVMRRSRPGKQVCLGFDRHREERKRAFRAKVPDAGVAHAFVIDPSTERARSNGQGLRPQANSRSSWGTPLSTERRTTKRPPLGSGGIGQWATRTPRLR